MRRSQYTERTVALVCKGWRWQMRAVHPQARRKALTSRARQTAICRAPSSGIKTTLYLTPVHAEESLSKSLIANAHATIWHLDAAAWN